MIFVVLNTQKYELNLASDGMQFLVFLDQQKDLFQKLGFETDSETLVNVLSKPAQESFLQEGFVKLLLGNRFPRVVLSVLFVIFRSDQSLVRYRPCRDELLDSRIETDRV